MRFAQEVSVFNPRAIELAVIGLGTRITQTAQEIRLEAAKTLANYSTTVEMQAAISVKADEITSEVSETYATQASVNGHVSSLSSKITQNAQAIELRVTKDGLISTINQTAGKVKINAAAIDLTGYVTASSLTSSGTTVIDGSRIQTGHMSADRISGGTISGVTFKTSGGGAYGDVTISGSEVHVPWINFVSNGTQYAGIAIDADETNHNSGRHRLITGHGIHVAKESDTWSWFEQWTVFDRGNSGGSDRRLKHEINPLDDELARQLVLGLHPVTFRYNGDDEHKHHGFIAQEVRALDLLEMNEIVNGDEAEGMLSLSYTDLIADLVSVIQAQERRIAALEGRADG